MRLQNNSELPLPSYESEGSSGMDIRAAVTDPVFLNPGEIKLIPTGFAVSNNKKPSFHVLIQAKFLLEKDL